MILKPTFRLKVRRMIWQFFGALLVLASVYFVLYVRTDDANFEVLSYSILTFAIGVLLGHFL